MLKKSVLAAAMVLATDGFSNILPPNDLHLQDNVHSMAANMTEQEFNEITNKIIDTYKPIVAAHGAKLVINARWDDSTVNASANQLFTYWMVNMYGGLARRPEVTPDGYAMVVCHELGHHLAGFPYASQWAANEGQSDYFATQACARKVWASETDINATYRDTAEVKVKEECDVRWQTETEQNLCYRVAMAGKSLAALLGALNSSAVPDFDTPDNSEVGSTNNAHPEAQCRLDTYFAGALCTIDFEESIIPGKQNRGGAQDEAMQYSCPRADGYTIAARPRCWFKP